MEFRNDKKMDALIRYVYYFIAGILCLFLILLTGRILDDLGSSTPSPTVDAYENKIITDSLKSVQAQITVQSERYQTKAFQLQKASELAAENYKNAKESFENWLITRRVIGTPDKDKEVLEKNRALDAYFKIQNDWNTELAKLNDTITDYQDQYNTVQQQVDIQQNIAQKGFNKAVQRYELHVFLIRLAFILPILLLGIFFYIRYRNHKYWPLYLGFTLFSIYAFFVGLIPYLPSYGGYVRYSVGILMAVIGGYYAINKIRDYLEKRKTELQKPTEERSQKMESEIAFKAFEQHICPSCGKDFLFKNWLSMRNNPSDSAFVVADYCRQCGFQLFKNCEQCGEKHFAHLPFCSSCGKKNTK